MLKKAQKDKEQRENFMRWRFQGLWNDSNFTKLWSSHTISNIGNGITGIALPLTAILVLSASPVQIGILSALDGIAVLLFGLIAGVLVDRIRRRSILIVTDIGRALLLTSIPVAALSGMLHIAQLYVVAALVSILTVFFNAADVSFLPELVQPEKLVEANSKLGISDSLSEIIGPSLAGLLVQLVSAPLAIIFDVFSFLASAFFVAHITRAKPFHVLPNAQNNLWHESIAGLGFIWKEPRLRAMAISAGLFNFTGMFIGTLYALYVVRNLHVAPAVYGVLIATGGVSTLIGAFFAERVIQRLGIGLTIGSSLFLYGLVGLLIPLAHGSVSIVVILLLTSQLIGDVAISIHLIAEVSLRQMLVPEHLMGRVNAGIQTLTRGAMPLSALLAGFLATSIGIRLTLLIGVVGVMVAGLWLLCSPVGNIRAFKEFAS